MTPGRGLWAMVPWVKVWVSWKNLGPYVGVEFPEILCSLVVSFLASLETCNFLDISSQIVSVPAFD